MIILNYKMSLRYDFNPRIDPFVRYRTTGGAGHSTHEVHHVENTKGHMSASAHALGNAADSVVKFFTFGLFDTHGSTGMLTDKK